MIKIGYQGDIGSNNEAAAGKFANRENLSEVVFVPLITSEGVADAMRQNTIDYGVMAISNSSAGEVSETKAVLKSGEFIQVAEITLPIHHCVFAVSDDEASILKLLSHKQVFMQCKDNIKRLFPKAELVEVADQAMVARLLSEEKSEKEAVICRKEAGEKSGLRLLFENVEDDENNTTTFGVFILQK